MKIKTITCHDVYNSGASLQAYALMKYLEEEGNEVEIIFKINLHISKTFSTFALSKQQG